jgi:hypothetical protein
VESRRLRLAAYAARMKETKNKCRSLWGISSKVAIWKTEKHRRIILRYVLGKYIGRMGDA